MIPTIERATLVDVFGERIVAFAESRGIHVVPLAYREPYKAASPALSRMQIDVDAWPAPPAGLFVVEERTVYLRARSSRMTLVHEFGHALDCALGDGIYVSGMDAEIRLAFHAARQFVTPYAATGLDEYFAECVRAFVGVNDPDRPAWNASPARLAAVDPAMFGIVTRLFNRLNAGCAA